MAPLQQCRRGGQPVGQGLPEPCYPPTPPPAPRPCYPTQHCLPAPSCLQACERNTKLADIIQRTGVTADYLWRKARAKDPKLTFKGITIKPKYTEDELDKRFTFCLDMLSAGMPYLRSIVFIDESSVALDPQSTLAIGRKGTELLVIDPRKQRDKREVTWIHYLLATCWATGLLTFEILSFTKGWDNPDDPVFHVSGAAPLLPCSPGLAQRGPSCHNWKCRAAA